MNEVREGRPLVGPSGEVNWQFAARYGRMYRDSAWVTNWRKIPLSDYEKKHLTSDEKREWTAALEAELRIVQPSTVVALGGFAVEALLGPGHSLFWSNGVAIKRKQGDFVVVPVVHPAAGLHDSSMLQRTAQGYEGAGRYLRGEVKARDGWAPAPSPAMWFYDPIPEAVGIDTEGTKQHPYMLQASWDGERYQIVYADDHAAVREFFAWLYRARPRLYIHRVLWDADVLAAIASAAGIHFNVWDFEVRDTAILAYNLQDIPTDLKNLSRAVLNRDMQEYLEVVKPHAEAARQAWRQQAYPAALARTSLVQQFTPKGKPRMKAGQPVFKRTGDPQALGICKHIERGQQFTLQEKVWAERITGQKEPGDELQYVPREDAEKYAGRDAANTRSLGPILERRVESAGLAGVAQLDHAVLPLAHSMQSTGLNIDTERYWQVLGEISSRRASLIEEIREIVAEAGFESKFSPGSPSDVADFCRYVWGKERKLGITKQTKTGLPSTESNVLMQLHDEHPFIPKILEYREHDKYENTYLLPLQPLIRQVGQGEWRVFVEFLVANVVSGRFATSRPNALAWPARTKLGLKIRSIFRARLGYKLAAWDLSQIELRILAAFSKDPVMLEAFLSGLDLHSNLAAKTFGKPYEECDTGPGRLLYRTPAKTSHYALVYGAGGGVLYETLRGQGITFFSKAACDALIADTWRLYRVAGTFLKDCAQEAREKGYVTGWPGRRRFLPGCRLVGDEWPIAGLRYEAERQAGNFKIQTPAATLLKRSMDTVWKVVYPTYNPRWGFSLWLQLHDELMGEIREDCFEEADGVMRGVMAQDSSLIAPLKIEVEGKCGDAWSDLK